MDYDKTIDIAYTNCIISSGIRVLNNHAFDSTYEMTYRMINLNHSITHFFELNDRHTKDSEIIKCLERNRNMTAKRTREQLLEIAIGLASLALPPYVVLEIFDWTLPFVHLYHRHLKVRIVHSIYNFTNSKLIKSLIE